MKYTTYIIVFLVSISNSITAQTFEWVRTHDYLNYKKSVIDENGNLYVTGSNFVLLKYDANGVPMWTINSTASDYLFGDIAISNDGYIYVGGFFKGYLELGLTELISANDNYGYSFSFFLAKFAPDGSVVWARKLNEYRQNTDIEMDIDNNSNIIIAGATADSLIIDTINIYNSGGVGFISKYNSSGTILWSRLVGNYSTSANGLKFIYDVSVMPDNKLIIAGAYSQTFTIDSMTFFTNTYCDAFIAKYSENGDFIWAHPSGTNTNSSVFNSTIKAGENGDFYLASSAVVNSTPYFGQYIIGYGSYDVVLSKHNNNGDCAWAKYYGSTDKEYVYDMIINDEKNIIITGGFSNDATFYPIILTNNSEPNHVDAYIVMTDSVGSPFNSISFGGPCCEEGFGISIDENGNLYSIGYLSDPIYFGSNLYGYTGGCSYAAKISGFVNSIENNTLKSNLLTIYPNPANDYIDIELPNKSNEFWNICIYNIVGEKVKSYPPLEGRAGVGIKALNVSNLNAGVYIVNVSSRGLSYSTTLQIID